MRIGIIGGGITGLTTALALHRTGSSSIVFERAPELNELGAGIWLQPNALKVLDWIGIRDVILRKGVELSHFAITDSRLKPFRSLGDSSGEDRTGFSSVSIHRGRLQKILHNAVSSTSEVRLNKTYVDHTAVPESVSVNFQDSREELDILLGADGINSSVRRALFPDSSLRDSGQVGWRGISDMELPTRYMKSGFEAWGKQIRFGFSPIAKGEVYWFAVAKKQHLEPADKTGHKDYLLQLFKDFDPQVEEIILHTDSGAIHHTVLYDLKRIPQWHKGPVCLLGDAAHATTPNMGQGACQGVEDAYNISRLLSGLSESPDKVFHTFRQKRKQKVDYVVRNSWVFGKMAHSIPGQYLMKMIFSVTPESILRAQMKRLYSIEQ